jgi:NitT/TauT family transport system substrate-binding protein
MVAAGLYTPGQVDLSKVATTQFVNRGVGVELSRRLQAR